MPLKEAWPKKRPSRRLGGKRKAARSRGAGAAAIKGPSAPRALGPGPRAQIQLQHLKIK